MRCGYTVLIPTIQINFACSVSLLLVWRVDDVARAILLGEYDFENETLETNSTI